MREMLARCIFNSLAQERHLNRDANGLQFKQSQGKVYFRPVAKSTGRSVIELSWIANGRRSIDISRKTLNGLFVNMISSDKTYFLLHGEPDNWVRIENVNASTSPKAAYCRVWPINHTEEVAPISTAEYRKVEDAHKIALEAAVKVHEFQMQTRVGRPPKDITLAKAIINSYQTIAGELAALLEKSR